VSRSLWAWTKSSYGHLTHAVSSFIAMERVATAVMLMLALFPAAALGKTGNRHPRGSTASTTPTSRTAAAAHSKSHNSGARRALRAADHAGSSSREPLTFGSGYSAPHGSKAVKLLQRRLVAAGFPPGPIDGRYGLLTERAVIGFQAAHGLHVDGVAGPITRTALAVAKPVLDPGTGYVRGGSGPVRRLQRQLAAAGYSPGPSDGRYGPRTERAVLRLQHARHLPADGIAGPRTRQQLQAILARRSHPQPNGVVSRPGSAHHRSRPRSGRPAGVPTPTRSAKAQPARLTHSGGSSPLWIVLAAGLLIAMLAGALWRSRRGRGDQSSAAAPGPDAGPGVPAAGRDPAAAFELGVMLVLARYRAVARSAFRRPDQGRHPNPEFDLGTLLPHEESRSAAEHAFQVADDRGHAGAACNLGVLLEQRGDLIGAREAYRRADERGHAVGAYNLGALLEQQGDLRGAIDAYRRADERGDSMGAYSLGVLLEGDGDLSGARAAYRRADQRGEPSARGALLELSRIGHPQRHPEDQGETAAVSEPDPAARPPARRADHTW
jgi:peptidoglycan hydrolase-like protein with peptidoglycan-binding domain/TPR repeat protein